MAAREFTDNAAGFLVPRQGQGAVGELSAAREIKKRGQKLTFFHSPGSAQLGNGKDTLLPRASGWRGKIVEGKRAVGGAQIDANGKLRHREIPFSPVPLPPAR